MDLRMAIVGGGEYWSEESSNWPHSAVPHADSLIIYLDREQMVLGILNPHSH